MFVKFIMDVYFVVFSHKDLKLITFLDVDHVTYLLSVHYPWVYYLKIYSQIVTFLYKYMLHIYTLSFNLLKPRVTVGEVLDLINNTTLTHLKLILIGVFTFVAPSSG
jgi:hypothetical protein